MDESSKQALAGLEISQKSLSQRLFGKLEAGSLRGAIFSLASTAIGAGCLLQPLILERVGMLGGLALQFFSVCLTYFGLIGIAEAADKHKIYDYPLLVASALGQGYSYVLRGSIILYVLGLITACNILIGEFIPSICHSWNIHFSQTDERILAIVFANLVLGIPLGLFKRLTSLRFISILSAFTLVYITVLSIAEFPEYKKQHNYDEIDYVTIDLYFFPTYAYCLFAFTCHTNLSQIQGELRDSNMRRITKVAFRAFMLLGIS